MHEVDTRFSQIAGLAPSCEPANFCYALAQVPRYWEFNSRTVPRVMCRDSGAGLAYSLHSSSSQLAISSPKEIPTALQ
jgi:hypothetical protein